MKQDNTELLIELFADEKQREEQRKQLEERKTMLEETFEQFREEHLTLEAAQAREGKMECERDRGITIICDELDHNFDIERAVHTMAQAMAKPNVELQKIAVASNEVAERLKEMSQALQVTLPEIEVVGKMPRVVLMGGRGSGKNILARELVENIVKQRIKVQHRGCHKHAELGGRTSKGDRVRNRQQWRNQINKGK